MNTIRILSFEEWCKAKEKAARQQLTAQLAEKGETECPECEGSGEGIAECDLGHEHEVTCDLCDGTGKVHGDCEPKPQLSPQDYEAEVLADIQALAAWLLKDPISLLIAADLSPYTTVHEQKWGRRLRLGNLAFDKAIDQPRHWRH